MTFNGKAKSTSQFFYDLNSDRESDICEKLEKVIVDYFSYYSTFQNKSPVQHIEAFSIDFKCSQGGDRGVHVPTTRGIGDYWIYAYFGDESGCHYDLSFGDCPGDDGG